VLSACALPAAAVPLPHTAGVLLSWESSALDSPYWVATVPSVAVTRKRQPHPSWSPDGRHIMLELPGELIEDSELPPDLWQRGPSTIASINLTTDDSETLVAGTVDANGAALTSPGAPAYRQPSQPALESPDLIGDQAYTQGTGSLSVRLHASDDGMGIARLSVAAGGVTDSSQESCGVGCP
jgi:hypothetical protein